MAIFQELNRQGMTVVIVTHEAEIADFAKRKLIFRDGLLVADNRNGKVLEADHILGELPKKRSASLGQESAGGDK
jgi:putative ABC transport system ATP-binding protein